MIKHSRNGDYLIAQHHALWGYPGGAPIDITPYKKEFHPLSVNGSILFLMDFNHKPVTMNGQFAPTPSKFHKITASSEMDKYIE